MNTFTYIDAKTAKDVTDNLGSGTQIIAGGTDLITRLRGMISPTPPSKLINIKNITAWSGIAQDSATGNLKIGALTKLVTIANDASVKDKYAALAQAAGRVGTPELRNMGTIGGNICQQCRCWYFRAEHNTFPCIRKNTPANTSPKPTICFAIAGDNRYHSIFGATDGCLAVNCSDVAPALVAFGATIKTNKKDWAAKDFFATVANKNEKMVAIGDDEVVTEIQIPAPAAGTKSAFMKFAVRKAFDFPIVNCAVVATSSGGTVSAASVVMNGVSFRPRLVDAAANALKGKAIDDTTAAAAGEAAVQGAVPMANNKYMVQIAKAMVKRTALACK